MTKITKKLIIAIIAITMVLGTLAIMAGCDANNLTLTQEVNAVGEQITYLQNGGTATDSELDELLAELARLRTEVERLQGDNAALLQRISDYEAQLEALRNTNGGNGELIAFIKGTTGILEGNAPYGTFLIRSHAQLMTIFENAEIIQWQDGISILERYNEAFFVDHALILHSFGGSGDNAPEFEVEKVLLNNRTLNMFILQNEQTEGNMYFSMSILVEVGQSDIENAKNIKANITVQSN